MKEEEDIVELIIWQDYMWSLRNRDEHEPNVAMRDDDDGRAAIAIARCNDLPLSPRLRSNTSHTLDMQSGE